VFGPALKDFLAHRKRSKEDTTTVLFCQTVVSKGSSAKEYQWIIKSQIRGTLKKIPTSQRVSVEN